MPDPQENAERIVDFLAGQPRRSGGNLPRPTSAADFGPRLLGSSRAADRAGQGRHGRGRGGSVRLLEDNAPTPAGTTAVTQPPSGPTPGPGGGPGLRTGPAGWAATGPRRLPATLCVDAGRRASPGRRPDRPSPRCHAASRLLHGHPAPSTTTPCEATATSSTVNSASRRSASSITRPWARSGRAGLSLPRSRVGPKPAPGAPRPGVSRSAGRPAVPRVLHRDHRPRRGPGIHILRHPEQPLREPRRHRPAQGLSPPGHPRP
jgi:hypothetical protein